jgi:hypothetical protein
MRSLNLNLSLTIDRDLSASILGNDFGLSKSSELLKLQQVKLVCHSLLQSDWRSFAA